MKWEMTMERGRGRRDRVLPFCLCQLVGNEESFRQTCQDYRQENSDQRVPWPFDLEAIYPLATQSPLPNKNPPSERVKTIRSKQRPVNSINQYNKWIFTSTVSLRIEFQVDDNDVL